jgi:hypothetical protein
LRAHWILDPELIVLVSTAFAAVALACGLAMILYCFVRNRLDEREGRWRSLLLTGFAGVLQTGAIPPALVDATRHHRRLAADVLDEMFDTLRSAGHTRLQELARAAELDRWLIGRLRSGNIELRLSAATTLSLFDRPETIAALTQTLQALDDEVSLAAALSLVDLGAAPPMTTMVRLLFEKRQQRSLRLRILFERIAGRSRDEVFEVAAGRVGEPFLRPIAIRALGVSGHAEDGERIVGFAGDPDPEVRAAAIEAIGALGYAPGRDAVASGLSDAVAFVRVRAVNAARRLELADLAPLVATLQDDANWWVQFRAREAFVALGGHKGRRSRSIPAARRKTPAGSAGRGLSERGAA